MGFLAIVRDYDQLASPCGQESAEQDQKRPQGRDEPSWLSHGRVLLCGRHVSLTEAPYFEDTCVYICRAHAAVSYGLEALPSVCQSHPAASNSSKAANRPPR